MSSPATNAVASASTSAENEIPRPKRIACIVCRKRKLRCDGGKPSCGTCARLGHNCSYDEIRRKSGPKRGYVKALEARLAQVETLLKDQSPGQEVQPPPGGCLGFAGTQSIDLPSYDVAGPAAYMTNKDGGAPPMFYSQPGRVRLGDPSEQNQSSFAPSAPPGLMQMDTGIPMMQAPCSTPLDWDIIAIGLDEALPAPDIIDSLHQSYFDKIHPCLPIIHKGRYLAGLDLAPSMRPPVALRYAIWTMAASVSEEYSSLQTHFYRLCRKYLEDCELRGHGEYMINIATSQTWSLIACYEFKLMYFPRAWLSTGRAVRLAQMMGMHRLDGAGLDVKQCLPAPKDWTEKEERRRTFWITFCIDRYASIGTGWPMTIEEKDILTDLPASDDAFDQGRPSRGISLKEAMTTEGASLLSTFGGVCLMACLFGRNLIHLHRPDGDERDDDLNGEFWRRHRNMDNILLNIALSLPPHFRLPGGIGDPNIVFTNMNIHTSTICLHQAAIFKAEKNRMPATVSQESRVRCITAAAEIASIMRMVSHLDLSGMNPFIAFCLYVAARCFVQYLKIRPEDEQVQSSLQFLLTAMGHLKKKNPLTESFLVQLDVDMTSTLDTPVTNSKFPYGLKKGQAEVFVAKEEGYYSPTTIEFTPCNKINPARQPPAAAAVAPPSLANEALASSPCMPHGTCKHLDRRTKTTPPSPNHSKHLGGAIPPICPCMPLETRTYVEACARESGLSVGYISLCSHNSDTDQSPGSMDLSLSDTSQTSHPTPNTASSSSVYSPLGIGGLASIGVDMSGYSQVTKDINWELLELESTFGDGGGLGGMAVEGFNGFYTGAMA